MAENSNSTGNGHTDTPKNAPGAPISAFHTKTTSNGHPGLKNALEAGVGAPKAITLARGKAGRWQKRFLEVFRQTGIVRAAAEAAGVERTQVYRYRERHPAFAMEWQKAIDESTELLELHCLQRATQGDNEPIWMNSKAGPQLVGTKKVKSDRLLEFMLRARKPMVYRDNVTQEVTGPGGQALAPIVIPQSIVFNIPGNGRADPAHTQQLPQSTPIEITAEPSKP